MSIAHSIDHTLLRPDLQKADILQCMDEASAYGFHSICIPPSMISIAAKIGLDRTYRLCTVAGFPAGYDHPEAKLTSIQHSVAAGAEEIDFVINLTLVKSSLWEKLQNDIQRCCDTIREGNALSKCIIETSLLTTDEIKAVCEICNEVQPDFVKTSTGFFGDPVQVDMILLLRKYLQNNIRIKASGGIRSFAQARALSEAGADRLGCSQSVQIVREELVYFSTASHEVN